MSEEDKAIDQDELQDEEALSEEEQAQEKLKEAISVNRTEIGALRYRLDITVPRDTVDERMGEQFAELKRDAVVPGFRKGHAPLKLVEKRFGADVGEQLKTQLISGGYMAAIEKEDIKTLGDPVFQVVVTERRVDEENKPSDVDVEKLVSLDEALDELDIPKEGDFTFVCEVEVKPEFELPELEGIPVTKTLGTVSDEDIETHLKRFAVQMGKSELVEDGAVEGDDWLMTSMTMTVDGESIATDSAMPVPARDAPVKGVFLDGLKAALTGTKLGETITIDGQVPEDHEIVSARGKTATFTFEVTEIRRWVVPELTDELLEEYGLESLEELRGNIKEHLESEREQVATRNMRDQIGEYLIDKTEMTLPEGLTLRQTERTLMRRTIDMLQAGIPNAEIEKMADNMRAEAREQGVKDVKLFFILDKIAEDLEIEITDEQMNAAIAGIAQQSGKRFDRVRDELSKDNGLEMLYMKLRDQQVLDKLLESAQVSE